MSQILLSSDSIELSTYTKTYSRDNTLDEADLERTIPLDNKRHTLHPTYHLGDFETLPVELLQEIFLQTDLRSLTNFRRVNQRAMQLIDEIPQYRVVVQHGLPVLRSILAIEAGSHNNLLGLVAALGTAYCQECGDFGGYIYAITCRRICYLCMRDSDSFIPVTGKEALEFLGKNRRQVLASLPTARTIPGRFSPHQYTSSSRHLLYDYDSVYQAGSRIYGQSEIFSRIPIEFCHGTARVHRLYRPKKEEPKGSRLISLRQFGVLVQAPHVKLPDNTVDFGFFCKGCAGFGYTRPWHWRRKYNLETFKAHLRLCGPVVSGSHVRPGNTGEG